MSEMWNWKSTSKEVLEGNYECFQRTVSLEAEYKIPTHSDQFLWCYNILNIALKSFYVFPLHIMIPNYYERLPLSTILQMPFTLAVDHCWAPHSKYVDSFGTARFVCLLLIYESILQEIKLFPNVTTL